MQKNKQALVQKQNRQQTPLTQQTKLRPKQQSVKTSPNNPIGTSRSVIANARERPNDWNDIPAERKLTLSSKAKAHKYRTRKLSVRQ